MFLLLTREAVTMKLNQIKNNLLHTGVAIALVTGMAYTLPSAYAGGKITIDDTKWISIGMGMRGGYNAVQGHRSRFARAKLCQTHKRGGE